MTDRIPTEEPARKDAPPDLSLCISFCEVAPPRATPYDLEALLAATCAQAGFPHCERLYAGSYFCENYFYFLRDEFHDSMRELCGKYDLGATLVVPIIGQAFLDRVEARVDDVLCRYGDVYDEVVVNDVAEFLAIADRYDKRVGLGRLFSKTPRDARYADMIERVSHAALSPESLECIDAACNPRSPERSPFRPLVEVDPTSAVVDVASIVQSAPNAEIAIHLPFCYATTGRNCGPASVEERDDEKFRIGRGCSQHCLRMAQGSLTDEGVRFVKHGRTFYFDNAQCSIQGAESWRIIYAAAHETMSVY